MCWSEWGPGAIDQYNLGFVYLSIVYLQLVLHLLIGMNSVLRYLKLVTIKLDILWVFSWRDKLFKRPDGATLERLNQFNIQTLSTIDLNSKTLDYELFRKIHVEKMELDQEPEFEKYKAVVR